MEEQENKALEDQSKEEVNEISTSKEETKVEENKPLVEEVIKEAEVEKLLSKEEIITLFQELLKEEDFQNRDLLNSWKKRFQTLTLEEEKEQETAFDAREDKDEEANFVFESNALDHRFKELLTIYKDKIVAQKAKKAEEEKQNLNIKEDLVDKLKVLVEENMQNVGLAFQTFYELRDKWNETGQVNKSKFKQLQYDYSHYRDLFYYNVGIHHELKNYDFKKNAEQKLALIGELKEVVKLESIREMEKAVKDVQARWDLIGPTSNETWEAIKNEYWDVVNAIYEKIKTHYKALRETQAKIKQEKLTLISTLEGIKEKVSEFKAPKEWIDLSNEVNDLHKKWKEAGFLGKANEDQIWTTFKGLSDELRTQKNAFFDALKKQNSTVVDAKNKLIERAETIKDSKDWKKTSEELIQLQKRWKSAGQGQYKVDQQLWEKFRTACDAFFSAKNEYFATLDDRQDANFEAKNNVAEKITKAKSEEELKTLIVEWQSIGYVPKKKITESDKALDKAIQEVGKGLKLDASSIANIKFESKIKAIKEDDNSEEKLKSERVFVQTQMDKIKEELYRFEENMSFFGPSKGAQKLKEIVEKKKDEAEARLEDWKAKLKMLRG